MAWSFGYDQVRGEIRVWVKKERERKKTGTEVIRVFNFNWSDTGSDGHRHNSKEIISTGSHIQTGSSN